MREIAVGALALLLGLVLGGVGPRAELNRMMQTVDSVDVERCKNTLGEDLASLFGAAKGGGVPLVGLSPPAPAPALARGPSAERLQHDTAEAEAMLEQIRAEEEAVAEEVRDEVRAALQDSEELLLARSALELRRAQARQALIDEADPDGGQLDEIDDAYESMNGTLEGLAGELAEIVLAGEEPDRRRAMEFAADALDAMLVAEDRVLRSLDEDQRAELGQDAANPFNHVAPGLIDALLELDEAP